jgi:hypothetical protein
VNRHLAPLAALAAALTLASVGAGSAAAVKAFPSVGILKPGVSLGGLQLGETTAEVAARWGNGYRVCPRSQCAGPDTVWYYIYGTAEPLGAAVRFNRSGHVTAVFTLGSPPGWRTADGLLIGQGVDAATELYGTLQFSVCLGYGAMSMRAAQTVSSIYTTGTAVYGFAITAPDEPICQ